MYKNSSKEHDANESITKNINHLIGKLKNLYTFKFRSIKFIKYINEVYNNRQIHVGK
jgi:hypothetical protein